MAQRGDGSGTFHTNRWGILAVLCFSVFLINASTLMMNVSLPTLVLELGATTRELQWIVDAFNLTFAAFVLAAGTLGDRFGRRRALITGIILFGITAIFGAFSEDSNSLIAWRAMMGVGAAIIFPTTLSIVVNIFTDRAERAKAIGIWGAASGLAVATGPFGAGLLLERFWWGSTLLALTPLAIVALALTIWLVPDSRDPDAPRLDWAGLALSTALLGTLVFTVIEAPAFGWLSVETMAGFILTLVLLVAFVRVEQQMTHPMLDVRLFRNLRFSAASGSVTLAFFALFGFIFLMTQYFQFIKDYSPLETGARLLPVAASLALASVVSIRLVLRFGTKIVVSTGLMLLAVGYAWVSRADAATSYREIAGQMVFIGVGMGFTTAPATEAIMGVVPKEKAGVGSAVNDATRELGGTLGVAVLGSVFASVYANRMADPVLDGSFPSATLNQARDSVGAALIAAQRMTEAGQPALGNQLASVAGNGFVDGLAVTCLVASAVAAGGALFAALLLPAQPMLAVLDDAAPMTPEDQNVAISAAD